jgi:AraC family transcriptional regulator
VDSLDRLNAAIGCIENNLRGDIDMDRVARLALNTPDGFTRLFSFITGVTLSVYIRRRRLTLAAFDLQNGCDRIIDIAARYGYESAPTRPPPESFLKSLFRRGCRRARRSGAPSRAAAAVSCHKLRIGKGLVVDCIRKSPG